MAYPEICLWRQHYSWSDFLFFYLVLIFLIIIICFIVLDSCVLCTLVCFLIIYINKNSVLFAGDEVGYLSTFFFLFLFHVQGFRKLTLFRVSFLNIDLTVIYYTPVLLSNEIITNFPCSTSVSGCIKKKG